MLNKSNIVFLIIFGVIILFFSRECSHREAQKQSNNRLKYVADTLRHAKLKNGQIAAEKQTLEITNKELEGVVYTTKQEKQVLLERIGKLSNLERKTSIGVTIRDTVNVTVRDTVILGDTAKSFKYADKYLFLNGILKDDSVTIDYEMSAKLDVAFIKKKGLRSVNITSDNPNLKITAIKDVSIIEPKKFYQRNGFWFVVGMVGAGILLR